MKRQLNRIVGITISILLFVCSISWAVTHSELKKYLVELPGWKAETPQGMTMENGSFKMVNATRTYTRGDKTLFVTISYGNSAQQFNINTPVGFKMETDTELAFTKNINGKKVSIFHSKTDKTGTITVLISPKLVLAVNYENMDWKEALELTKKFNWKRLESIK
ncbi:MAG: hypothetical protein GXO44_02710 [Deferribacteres bacterium]|nr:hypothetical protein [Deferribacteres bacterium]